MESYEIAPIPPTPPLRQLGHGHWPLILRRVAPDLATLLDERYRNCYLSMYCTRLHPDGVAARLVIDQVTGVIWCGHGECAYTGHIADILPSRIQGPPEALIALVKNLIPSSPVFATTSPGRPYVAAHGTVLPGQGQAPITMEPRNDENPATSGAVLRPYSQVQSENVNWYWQGFIPCSMVSILQGDPENGKSLSLLDLIARRSRGDTLPNDDRRLDPMGAIFISAEDSASHTIQPRLQAAGADLRGAGNLWT